MVFDTRPAHECKLARVCTRRPICASVAGSRVPLSANMSKSKSLRKPLLLLLPPPPPPRMVVAAKVEGEGAELGGVAAAGEAVGAKREARQVQPAGGACRQGRHGINEGVAVIAKVVGIIDEAEGREGG